VLPFASGFAVSAVPGKTVPGKAVPGKTVPGKTVPISTTSATVLASVEVGKGTARRARGMGPPTWPLSIRAAGRAVSPLNFKAWTVPGPAKGPPSAAKAGPLRGKSMPTRKIVPARKAKKEVLETEVA